MMATGTETGATGRRTQAQRSEATRRALLAAAVATLVEDGYARTTTGRVCDRAGLSRGAHLHHFGTRAALIGAALVHYGEQVVADAQARFDALPDGEDRTARALDLLWELYTGPVLGAAIDLWAAARWDPELARALEPIERTVDRRAKAFCRHVLPHRASRPDFERDIDFVLSTVRGLALMAFVRPGRSTAPRWPHARERLLRSLSTG